MANDFTGETRLKALWKLDNGANTTDSIGTNTLTASASPPTNDTTNKKEGDAAGLFAGSSSQFLKIADANLDAGMPLKTGDTAKIGMWSCWFRCTSLPGSGAWSAIMAKQNYAGRKISLLLGLTNSKLYLNWGYGTGQSVETWNVTGTLTANRWYHVALIFNGISKTAHIRLWDDVAGTATNYDKTHINELRISDCDFSLGAEATDGTPASFYTGQLDEVLVSNSNLWNDSEIDLIRAGTFTPKIIVSQVTGQVAWTKSPSINAEQVIGQVAWTPTPGIVVGGVGLEVAYLPTPQMKLESVIAQVEVEKPPAGAGIYVSSVLAQLEYMIQTNLELPVDTISIDIDMLAPTIQLVCAQEAVNIAIEALSMFPPGFGVSVSTENILITPLIVRTAIAVTPTTIALEMLALAVTVELIGKRIFPLAPNERVQQTQVYKRKFPVGH